MRLLKLDSQGRPSLTKDLILNIPDYAILSHTWSENNEDEVTFEDLNTPGSGKSKLGFVKIEFCAKQAQEDGLQYFWIDTCCIDKKNSSELSEAIISMFKWYKNAKKCYVYLSDVPANNSTTGSKVEYEWESKLSKSRWFTRGWTLQELIAPSDVKFFSFEGKSLGTKEKLEQQIHRITGIPVDALHGTQPLSAFTLDERLSWTARRQTTREEDTAYCLMGIVGIHMPPMYGEGRQSAWDRLQREIKISSNPELFVASDAPWIVPFERNPNFTGRDEQLADLDKELSAAKDHTLKIAITGLGGIGKTQLVLELLYRTKKKYKNRSIIWIPAANTESLHQGYYAAARGLNLPASQDGKTDVKKLVQDCLSQKDTNDWVLVFDNADDIDMWLATPKPEPESANSAQVSGEPQRLVDCLPKSNRGCIIFTTRDMKTAGKLAPQIVKLSEMDKEVTKDLLRKCLGNSFDLVDSNLQDTTALLSELTHLPLAIVQAAAYIVANSITLVDYLQLLKAKKEEEVIGLLSEDFEDDGRYKNMKNPVAATWLISFEQIQQRNRLAAEYLSFMACILPKDIPQSLLPPAPSQKEELDAIGTLLAYSFITRRPKELVLDLHRLVHLSTRNWLRERKILGQWTEKRITRLAEIFPNHDPKNRSIWRLYLPHTCHALASDLVDKGETELDLMQRCANCLYSDGRLNEAEELEVQVLEARNRVLGPEHPDTLASMNNLASTYKSQGRWNKAEDLQVQVLKIIKRVLGLEHRDTLISMSNLVLLYNDQGQWGKAEELGVQLLEIMKRVLGPEHPSTLVSMGNLASTYGNQGQWSRAEELGVQVLEMKKRVLGPEHPNTLVSMANLACTYKDKGYDGKAIELMSSCANLRTKVMGPSHYLTKPTQSTLMKWQMESADSGRQEDQQTNSMPGALLRVAYVTRIYIRMPEY